MEHGKPDEMRPALLLLADGTLFEGRATGKAGTATGEICFNTGMTGYQEVFTDPSYAGQILVMTNAHIGNYGTHAGEVESDGVKIAGLVTRNFTNLYSRNAATQPIQEYLEQNGVTGISGIDTRALVRHIRSKGAMNAIISSVVSDIAELKSLLDAVPSMEGLELSSRVSTKEAYYFGDESAPHKVAVLDLGIKRSILRCLMDRGCYLKVFPARSPLSDMMDWKPDGFFISNGPGDPAAMPYAVNTVKEMLETGKPLFAICLGHQLLALAKGAQTYKLHHGHRGLNHPVKNLFSGGCEITSQNHGFGVSPEGVVPANGLEITHVNLNDGSVEGLKSAGGKAFSVQYHPEASAGPHDSRYLFDQFAAILESAKTGARKLEKANSLS